MEATTQPSNIEEKEETAQNTSSDLSEDDELVEPWENLLLFLSLKHFEKLCDLFHKPAEGSFKREPIQLTQEEFVEVIDSVVGNSCFSYQAISLFNELPYPTQEKITWIQLQQFYMEYSNVVEYRNLSLSQEEIRKMPHIKHDSIMKILLMETPSSFGYAIISKYGKMGIYNGDLKLLMKYDIIFIRNDELKIGKPRHRRSTWITDGIFIPNICLIVISTSARTLICYDASSLMHKPLWLIEGIGDTIQSLSYCFKPEFNLLLGSEKGSLIRIRFLQQKNGLLRKKYNNKINAYFWRELFEETAYVSIKIMKNHHSCCIDSLYYCGSSNSIVTCSSDRKQTVIFYDLNDNKKTYIFKINEGVTCFSVSYKLLLLLTGSRRGTIHFWNSVVTTTPISTFTESTAIVDVKILEAKRIALSCSKNGTLKVWDITEHKCQQVLHLKFPAFDVLGKSIEWGKSPIYPGPKRAVVAEIKICDDTYNTIMNKVKDNRQDDPWNRCDILITCCEYIGIIDILYETELIVRENKEKPQCFPPPALQNDVIIPSQWNAMTEKVEAEEDVEEESQEDSSKTSDRQRAVGLNVQEIIENALEEYEKMDFHKILNLKDCRINRTMAELEAKKQEMRKTVAQSAPFLALDIHDIEEISLRDNLPVPNSKKSQKLVDRTYRMLSAASYRSGILSDRSSRSRSSRSSIIEF